MDSTKEIVFAQLLNLLGLRVNRESLIYLIGRFSSYGQIVKLSIVGLLQNTQKMHSDEIRPQIKNLKTTETDNFVSQALQFF